MAIIYWKVDGTTLKLRSGSASGYSDFDDEFPGAPDWASYITNVTKVIIENNISPSNMYAWFIDCSKVTEIQYIQRINTSNVTDMSHMFDNCQALTSLDVSSFNTSNVTNMRSMFYNCQALTSLDVSNFDTSKVTTMAGMFKNCKALTTLDLSDFDTSSVTLMNTMFDNCQALTSLTLSSSFDTSNVTSMSYMFQNCKALTSLDVSSFNTSNVTNMSSMFYDCQALTTLDVSDFDTSNVIGMKAMFYHCQALTSLDVSGFNTSKVINMSEMFSGCASLTSLDVSSFDTSNVTDMKKMFEECQTLTSLNLSSFNTSNVTDMDNMFYNCQALTTIFVSSTLFKTTQVTSSSNMFYNCTSLIGSKGTAYNSSYIDKTYAHTDEGISNPGYFTYKCLCAEFDSETGYLRIFSSTIEYTNGQTIGTKTYYTDIDQIIGNTYPKWYSIRNSITKVIIEDLFKPRTVYYLFSSTSLEEIEGIEYLNTSNVTSMSYMFYNCKALTSLDLSGFDTSNVINMNNMFDNCRTLTELDVSGFNTSNVASMSYMFNYCWALTSLTLSSSFNTSNVTNISYMFYNCRALTTLDLSGFDTSNVTSMCSVFRNCWALITLDLSGFDTSDVTDMSSMFDNCRALTSLDLSNFNTSNVTDMNSMFNNCKELISLDVLNFDTSNVTNMSDMFNNCKLLTSLNILNFNTSKVTNMICMFQYCMNLTSLDVSSFNTSNVTNMTNMFYYCNSLTSLDISNFVFSNNVNINSMFEGCASLTGAIRINSNPGSYIDMFKNTVEEIVLLGNSTLLNSFTTTANNHNVYVWSLSIQPRAERDKEIGDSVNFSVEVTRFAGNQGEIEIEATVNDVSVPLTWNEPLIMDTNRKTFTATLTNVDENASITYTFIVEDIYGKSLSRSITVPTNYYTIDFLKGGKEISFGEKADQDDLFELLISEPSDWSTNWADYYEIVNEEYVSVSDLSAPIFATDTYYKKIHDSLFKCKMDSSFNDMTPAEVSDFISDLDISGSPIELTQADWVVEQGITGDWTWRKWQSGIAECWGRAITLPASTFAAWGNIYYHDYFSVATFPITFNATPLLQITSWESQVWVGSFWSTTTTNVGTVRMLGTSTTSKTPVINVYAQGRWK